jgi:hypothetical protein
MLVCNLLRNRRRYMQAQQHTESIAFTVFQLHGDIHHLHLKEEASALSTQ